MQAGWDCLCEGPGWIELGGEMAKISGRREVSRWSEREGDVLKEEGEEPNLTLQCHYVWPSSPTPNHLSRWCDDIIITHVVALRVPGVAPSSTYGCVCRDRQSE